MMRRSVRYVARGIDADQLHPAFTFFRDGADRQVGVQVMLLLELLPENIGHRGRSVRMAHGGSERVGLLSFAGSARASMPTSAQTCERIMDGSIPRRGMGHASTIPAATCSRASRNSSRDS